MVFDSKFATTMVESLLHFKSGGLQKKFLLLKELSRHYLLILLL